MAEHKTSDEAFNRWVAKQGQGTSADRKKRKGQELAGVDGRSRRHTGRTQQFNFKAKEAWADDVKKAAEARQISIPEMLERIVSEWKAAKLPGKDNDYPSTK